MSYYDRVNIEELIGKTLTEINNLGDELIFTVEGGDQYKMYHSQDCCESVGIEDINGDLNDLIGSPILKAEEVSNENDPEGFDSSNYESYTWTFYHLATIKGYVTIRWFGYSNGYYGEGVDFEKI